MRHHIIEVARKTDDGILLAGQIDDAKYERQ